MDVAVCTGSISLSIAGLIMSPIVRSPLYLSQMSALCALLTSGKALIDTVSKPEKAFSIAQLQLHVNTSLKFAAHSKQ